MPNGACLTVTSLTSPLLSSDTYAHPSYKYSSFCWGTWLIAHPTRREQRCPACRLFGEAFQAAPVPELVGLT